jgi:hypothetical protein
MLVSPCGDAKPFQVPKSSIGIETSSMRRDLFPTILQDLPLSAMTHLPLRHSAVTRDLRIEGFQNVARLTRQESCRVYLRL